jgi:hypothetical protein
MNSHKNGLTTRIVSSGQDVGKRKYFGNNHPGGVKGPFCKKELLVGFNCGFVANDTVNYVDERQKMIDAVNVRPIMPANFIG